MLKALSESEQNFSAEAGVVIPEVQVSLVCEESHTTIIRKAGRFGLDISGWVYVSPIEQVLPIGGKGT